MNEFVRQAERKLRDVDRQAGGERGSRDQRHDAHADGDDDGHRDDDDAATVVVVVAAAAAAAGGE